MLGEIDYYIYFLSHRWPLGATPASALSFSRHCLRDEQRNSDLDHSLQDFSTIGLFGGREGTGFLAQPSSCPLGSLAISQEDQL